MQATPACVRPDVARRASAQLALVGHDVGHNQIFHRRSLDSLVGLGISFFLGASVQWWKCGPRAAVVCA
jgi:fatty acid desaturase